MCIRDRGYIDLLSGGAFSNSTLFALGISPYITASIVIQLLAVAIPALEQLAKEGEEGRKILNKYTRYCTVALGLLQSVAYYCLLYTSRYGRPQAGRVRSHKNIQGPRWLQDK